MSVRQAFSIDPDLSLIQAQKVLAVIIVILKRDGKILW